MTTNNPGKLSTKLDYDSLGEKIQTLNTRARKSRQAKLADRMFKQLYALGSQKASPQQEIPSESKVSTSKRLVQPKPILGDALIIAGKQLVALKDHGNGEKHQPKDDDLIWQLLQAASSEEKTNESSPLNTPVRSSSMDAVSEFSKDSSSSRKRKTASSIELPEQQESESPTWRGIDSLMPMDSSSGNGGKDMEDNPWLLPTTWTSPRYKWESFSDTPIVGLPESPLREDLSQSDLLLSSSPPMYLGKTLKQDSPTMETSWTLFKED